MTLLDLLRATALVGVAALLGGCGTTGSGSAASAGPVRIVASTNVYGDIARTIGGPQVTVTSIVSNPDQDPHSFEADPRTALAVSRADLLIENGGGYDDFMGRLRSSTGSRAPVIDVVDLSGKKAPASGELNEHVWYDLPTVEKVAEDVADHLGHLDRRHAAQFTARARTFDARLDRLIAREHELSGRFHGTAIGITEPVPLYLTTASGLVNLTPPKFSEAVEEGDDVAAPVLEQTLDQYRQKKVRALFYNVQTGGPITEKVKTAAKDAGIPVVPVTETLPTGEHYVSWMSANLTALAKAVGR